MKLESRDQSIENVQFTVQFVKLDRFVNGMTFKLSWVTLFLRLLQSKSNQWVNFNRANKKCPFITYSVKWCWIPSQNRKLSAFQWEKVMHFSQKMKIAIKIPSKCVSDLKSRHLFQPRSQILSGSIFFFQIQSFHYECHESFLWLIPIVRLYMNNERGVTIATSFVPCIWPLLVPLARNYHINHKIIARQSNGNILINGNIRTKKRERNRISFNV